MTLEELIKTYPDVETYFRYMPEELKTRYTIRTFPPWNHHSPEGLSTRLFRNRGQRRPSGNQRI